MAAETWNKFIETLYPVIPILQVISSSGKVVYLQISLIAWLKKAVLTLHNRGKYVSKATRNEGVATRVVA